MTAKSIPGPTIIILQGVLLAGVFYGAIGGLSGRQRSRAHPPIIKEVAAHSPAAVVSSPLPEKQNTYRFYGPGGKYRVEVQDIAASQEPDARNAQLSLIHQKTKRTLWKRTVSAAYNQDIFWSEDGRATAIVDYGASNLIRRHRILVWREGERVSEFQSRDFLDHEGIEDLLWSPNKHSLLLRGSYAMGNQSVGGPYALWHVRLPSGRARLLSPSVDRMEWLSNDKVRYWTREIKLEGTQDSSSYGDWSRVDTHIGVREQSIR
jgi:hypothetical protein